MAELPKLVCNVCDKNEALGVASSPFGAISFAYCQECLKKPAEPESMFNYLYCDVADGDVNNLIPYVKTYYTFHEGEYISWNEWVEKVGSKIDMEGYRKSMTEI